MRSPRSDGQETKQRIIEAASSVFADVGYTEGTIAWICETANVNQAAVNYHFGGKEELYREVWDYTRAEADEVYPIETPPGKPAEERLRVFLHHHIHRTLDEGPAGRFSRILANEIHDLQPFLAERMSEDWNRMNHIFESILRDFIGPEMTDQDLELCRFTIIAPCLGLGMRLMKQRKKTILHKYPPRFEPDVLAEHVFRFARAGLLDLKERIAERGFSPTVEEKP